MAKFLTVAGLLAVSFGLSSPALGQQAQTQDAVMNDCRAVAVAEQSAGMESNPLRGHCISATGSYLAVVGALNLPQPIFDQTIGDLVVELANILFTPECRIESEIAQAIAMAESVTVDDDQRAQIRLIYDTVRACDFVVTAAIFTPFDTTPLSSSAPGGVEASQN